jgi:hypothetical protein
VFGEVPHEDAVAAIVRAFERGFGEDGDQVERAQYVEDAEGMRPYEEEARRRTTERPVRCRVERVGFIDPNRARVRFALTLTSGGTFVAEGSAVRQDGRWRVSRETQVDLLRRGGVDVPGGPT